MENKKYDIIILGSGLGGTMLAAILAKQGMEVLVLEKGQHPRFAIGESTTPSATIPFKMIGERFGIPEISALSNFWDAASEYGNSQGVKHAFSFVMHEKGKELDKMKANQLPTMAALGSDVHLFRQDTDAAMVNTAIRYGAEVRQRVEVSEIELDGDPVKLTSSKGEVFEADYLVDATGFGSPVVRKLNLRDEERAFKTNSRSVFTHLVDVPAFDEIIPRKELGLMYNTHQSTLHHVFESGWFWVIPFDNHRLSTNRVCSVGVNLNCDAHPAEGRPAGEKEFFDVVNQYPSIKRHLGNAKSVQPWISTGRMQFACKEVLGENWVLMPHAAGFIDPLFSAGLPQTLSAIYQLGVNLPQGKRPGDEYRKMVFSSFDSADDMVGGAYKAMSRGYDNWNAWLRIWSIGSVLTPFMQVIGLTKYYRTKNTDFMDQVRQPEYSGLWGTGMPVMRQLLTDAVDIVFDESLSDSETSIKLRDQVEAVGFLSEVLKYKDFNRRSVAPFTLDVMTRFGLKQPKLLEKYLTDSIGGPSFVGLIQEEMSNIMGWKMRNLTHSIQRLMRLGFTGGALPRSSM